MKKIGIFGHTGMVGEEIEGILKGHDLVEIAYKQNSQRAEGQLSICDLVILATHETESMEFAETLLSQNKKVLDMSGAFRLKNVEDFEKWYGVKHKSKELLEKAVYGMPAFYEDKIKSAQLVANPGCYPTSVILPLKPLYNMLAGNVIIFSTSGISGARQEPSSISNERTYNYGRRHKHVPEMEAYSGFYVESFTPVVIESVRQGINTNIQAELSKELKLSSNEKAAQLLVNKISQAYKPEDLVTVASDEKGGKGTKEVNYTNKALINVRVEDGTAFICSMIDNLWKGAASQAIENINLMLGLPRLYSLNRD